MTLWACLLDRGQAFLYLPKAVCARPCRTAFYYLSGLCPTLQDRFFILNGLI